MGGHRDDESGRRRRHHHHHQPKPYPPAPAPPPLDEEASSRSPSREHRRSVQRSEGLTPRSTARERFPSIEAAAAAAASAMPPSTKPISRSSTMPYNGSSSNSRRRPSDPRAYAAGDDPAAYPPRRYSAGHGGSSYEGRRYNIRRDSAPLYEDVPPRVASPDPVTSSDASESEDEESSEDEETDEDEEQDEEEADDEASISRRRGRPRPERAPEPPSAEPPNPRRRYQGPPTSSSEEDEVEIEEESSVPPSPTSTGAHLRRRAIEGTPQPRMIEAPPRRREVSATPSPRTSRSRVSSVRAETRPPVSTKRPPKRGKNVIHHEPMPTRSRNMTPSSRASTRSSSHRRPTNVLEGLIPNSSGHRTSPEKGRSKDHGKEKVIKSVECVACMENKTQVKAPKLKCGHRMCQSCLKKIFVLSTKDAQSMPPKCCAQAISLKHADPLFDEKFKRGWNRKRAEFRTTNPVYCPSKKCGAWINPSLFKQDGHRQSAHCGSCKKKMCVSCHSKWHTSPDCPRDEETQKILKQAKEFGWQRCHSCNHVVERKEGCNHMTCRCGAQFCMACGVKWRNCDCEWFNFETDDNLGGYYAERSNPADVFDGDGPPVPRLYRSGTEPLPRSSARPRSRNREEPRYYRHKQQEEQDEDLARRLQYEMSLSGSESSEDDEDDDMLGEGVGLGISGGRAASEHYEHRRRGSGRTTLPPAPEPPIGRSYEREQTYPSTRKYESSSKYETPTSKYEAPTSKYETSSKYETPTKYHERGSYVTEVHRARASRGSKGERSRSMERRLANRLSETRYNTPGRDMPMGPPTHMSPQHHNMSPHMGPPPPMPMGGPHPGPMPMPMPMPMNMPPPQRGPMMMGPMHPPSFGSQPYAGATYPPPPPPGYMGDKGPYGSPDLDGRRRRDSDSVPRSSTLAGLDGPHGGVNRVFEWRNFVDPNGPGTYEDEESVQS